MSQIDLTKSEFHLYVVELTGLGVKVGISKMPNRRISRHRRDAERYARPVGRVWVSQPHVEARDNERALIALGGPGNLCEYITVNYDAAVALADSLPKTRSPQSVRDSEADEQSMVVSFFWPTGTTREDVARKLVEAFG